MDWQTIIAIIVGVFGVISVVAWASIFTKAQKVWVNMNLLKDEYLAASSDGVISDSEKAKIADIVIFIIADSIDIWQAMTNMAIQLLQILSRIRPPAGKALKKVRGY
mgnify:CR=1 FL=1